MTRLFILVAVLIALSSASAASAQTTAVDFYNHGVERYNAKDWDAAIADFTRTLELSPKATAAYHARGLSYQCKGDNNRAIEDFTKALEIAPDHVRSLYSRAEALSQRRGNEGSDIRVAHEDLAKLITLQPQSAEAFALRALVYEHQRDYANAISDYTTVLKLNPKDDSIYLRRGDVFRDKGDHDSAIADYDRYVLANPGESGGYFSRGLVLFAKADLNKALLDFNKAIELDPTESNPWFHRARINLILNQGDAAYRDAAKYLDIEGGEDPLSDEVFLTGYFGLRKSNKPVEAKAFLASGIKGLRESSVKIVRYLIGELTDKELLADRLVNQIMAHLYIGMNLALEGNRPGALEHLRLASDSSKSPVYDFQHFLADAELQRLQSAPVNAEKPKKL